MSILIKGMEMPDCCANCPFQILEREKYISFQYVIDASECEICDGFMTEHESYSKMLPKCPLVEVPPHGRLIDADVFNAEQRHLYCENCARRKGMKNGKMKFVYDIGDAPCRACGYGDVLDDIDAVPTIIEAEGA